MYQIKKFVRSNIVRNTTKQSEPLLLSCTREELSAMQVRDPDIGPIVEWKRSGQRPEWQDISAMSVVTKAYWAQWESIAMIDEILYRRWEGPYGKEVKYLYLTPKAIYDEILRNLHDSSTSGHFGFKKTLSRVRSRFYWIKLRWTVENWCKRCDKCAARKGYPRRVKVPLNLQWKE